jgi:hypothetical protein
MKTVKTAESRATNQKEIFGANMRFLAISATIPNADDVSTVTVLTEVILINLTLSCQWNHCLIDKIHIKINNTKIYKICKLHRGIFFALSYNISQHFTTKLCNFTDFGMLFNAVIMN